MDKNLTFLDKTKDKEFIQRINNPKLILVLNYLYRNTTRENLVKFTLEGIITECGYKPKAGKGKMNEQFKNILIELDKLKIIEIKNIIHKEIIIDVDNLTIKNLKTIIH